MSFQSRLVAINTIIEVFSLFFFIPSNSRLINLLMKL